MRRVATLLVAAATAPAAALRFAVCLVGQVRTLEYEAQLMNVKRMLVDSLPGEVDVFAFFDSVQDEAPARALAARLGAKHTCFMRSPPSLFGDECPWKGGGPGADSFHTQAAKVVACFDRVRAHELLQGVAYDYVVRTRPDLGFYAPVSSWLRLDSNAVFTGLNHDDEVCGNQQDFFAVVPSRHTGAYRTLLDVVLNCTRPPADFECGRLCPPPGGWVPGARTDFGPECYLGTQLALHRASSFGCYDKWVESTPWVWATPRQQNLWTLVRRACLGASGEWAVLFGEARCEGVTGPYDQFMLRPFTGEAVPGLPRAPSRPQDPRCGARA